MSRALDSLVANGMLSPVAVILSPSAERYRRLYWTNEFEIWCRNVIGQQHGQSFLTAGEQLNLVFENFVTGRALSSGLAKCDPPRGEGIWRLKTPSFRLYGWADEPQTMVLAVGESKSKIAAPGPPKDKDLGKQAVTIRRQLGLKYMIGERYEIFPAIDR